ncbi:MAG: hypothetical protein O3B73_13235 [bacterium]|nr:hypothetical protein [bacterium]
MGDAVWHRPEQAGFGQVWDSANKRDEQGLTGQIKGYFPAGQYGKYQITLQVPRMTHGVQASHFDSKIIGKPVPVTREFGCRQIRWAEYEGRVGYEHG